MIDKIERPGVRSRLNTTLRPEVGTDRAIHPCNFGSAFVRTDSGALHRSLIKAGAVLAELRLKA
jgi:hypothetical protein